VEEDDRRTGAHNVVPDVEAVGPHERHAQPSGFPSTGASAARSMWR
jgi:hypothetical protein